MTRREYFDLCMGEGAHWLQWCADNPTPSMRPRHVALVRLAIRAKERAAAEAARVPTTCIEHAYDATTRLSFQIKVF